MKKSDPSGQCRVDDKSNEITAIPELLDMLSCEGATITLDAMGCQQAMTEKIINKKGNDLFRLKGNQGAWLAFATTMHEKAQEIHYIAVNC